MGYNLDMWEIQTPIPSYGDKRNILHSIYYLYLTIYLLTAAGISLLNPQKILISFPTLVFI